MTRRTLRALGLVLAVALLASAPALLMGYPVGDSAAFNLRWAAEFSRQFWSGDLYPRWLATSFRELGAPSFYFYPPLPFWMSSIFVPAIGDHPPRYGLAMANAAVTMFAGTTCYFWLRDICQARIPAAIGAAFFVLAPYQLAANFYVRAAYAEYVGAALLPLVLMMARRAALGSSGAALGLAASYAALILSHLPTTLIASALPAVAPIFFRSGSSLIVSCLRVWIAMLLGIALAAGYLIPALLEQGLIHPEIWSGSHYRHYDWYLPSGERLKLQPLPLHALAIDIALGAAAIALILWLRRRSSAVAAIPGSFLFCCTMTLGAAFMTTRYSSLLWDFLPILQRVQFPWRFLGVVELGVAGLASILVASVAGRESNRRIRSVPLAVMALAILVAFDVHTIRHQAFPRPEILRTLDQWVALGVEAREYTVAAAPLELTGLSIQSNGPAYERLPDVPGRFRIVSGSGDVTIVRWKPPHDIGVEISSTTGLRLELAHFHFPIFRSELTGPDGRTRPHSMQPSALGLMQMELPAGNGQRLRIAAGMLDSERWGAIVSGVALAIWLAGFVLLLRPGGRRSRVA